MQNNNVTNLKIPGINPFDFHIKYTETTRDSHRHEIDLHTHNEFELYINISGDVSFLVENALYPLSRGDVIIARPGEWHHCIYRSEKPHKLFWILFDCQQNNSLFDFLQPDSCENFISPSAELKDELLNLCYDLHSENLTKEEQIYSFFRIFSILKQSQHKNLKATSNLPQDLSRIIDYIDQHIHEKLIVAEIAQKLYISQSTLERRFKQTLNTTPLEYIRRKKLLLAAQLLQSGKSVLQAGTSVGYNDNSHFIKLFKHYFDITPYEYKNTCK